ncbi:MAG: hypothetical protein V1792_13310 [Pseudomonadota bacterium]
MNTIYKRLQELKDPEQSWNEFGKQYGIPAPTISLWKRGHSVSQRWLERLSEIFNRSVDWWLTDSESTEITVSDLPSPDYFWMRLDEIERFDKDSSCEFREKVQNLTKLHSVARKENSNILITRYLAEYIRLGTYEAMITTNLIKAYFPSQQENSNGPPLNNIAYLGARLLPNLDSRGGITPVLVDSLIQAEALQTAFCRREIYNDLAITYVLVPVNDPLTDLSAHYLYRHPDDRSGLHVAVRIEKISDGYNLVAIRNDEVMTTVTELEPYLSARILFAIFAPIGNNPKEE